jgi:hypothetical protein
MVANSNDIISLILGFLSAYANLLTALAALSAVIIAVLSEVRAQKRFEKGNEIQEKIAAASIKPLLSINESLAFNGHVMLLNDGLGPALMTEIIFRKGDTRGNSVHSVFDPAFNFQWRLAYKEFPLGTGYLRAGERFNLLFLDLNDLKRQGLTTDTINAAVQALGSQIAGVQITIHYEDVLGNKQADLQVTL